MNNVQQIIVSRGNGKVTFGEINVGDVFTHEDTDGEITAYVKIGYTNAQILGSVFEEGFVLEALIYKAKKVHVEY